MFKMTVTNDVFRQAEESSSSQMITGWFGALLPLAPVESGNVTPPTASNLFNLRDSTVRQRSIKSLALPTRITNCLAIANIKTLGELLDTTPNQLLGMRSFGHTSLRYMQRTLKEDFGIEVQITAMNDSLLSRVGEQSARPQNGAAI